MATSEPFEGVPLLLAAVKEAIETELGYTKAEGTASVPEEEEELVLLNMLYAPQSSRLHSLLKTLARIKP